MPGSFAVVTDSTSDIPHEITQEMGITVVPLSVSFGGETHLDGEMTQAEFFARMKSAPALPTTSQPPMGAFAEVYEQALSTAEQVVSVHISNRLSGTIESARQAAELFAGRVHVFDSLTLSMALGYQVLEAASAAAEGLSVEAALERVDDVRRRICLIVGLDSLDNLARGGRIGKVSAMMGAMLNLKVTLTVDENGEFVPVARTRGEHGALEHTLEWVSRQMGDSKRGLFAVGHALSEARAHSLADALRERYEVERMVVYETGSVISTHTGTGWGVVALPLG